MQSYFLIFVSAARSEIRARQENQFLTRTNCTFSQHIVQNENFRYLLIDLEIIFGWEK